MASTLLIVVLVFCYANCHNIFTFSRSRSFDLQNVSVVTTLVQISINTCSTECKSRRRCKFIVYSRRNKVCQLLSLKESDFKVEIIQDNSCLYGAKTTWDMSAYSSCNECSSSAVCEQTGGSIPICDTEECVIPPAQDDVMMQGNLLTTGSTIVQTCESTTIHNTVRSECLPDGTWSNLALTCGVPCPYDAMYTHGMVGTQTFSYLVIEDVMLPDVAENTCRTIYCGELMEILTPEKHEYMKLIVESYGADLFINGQYDEGTGQWRTTRGNVVPTSYASMWDKLIFSADNPRLIMRHNKQYDLEGHNYDHGHIFICEQI